MADRIFQAASPGAPAVSICRALSYPTTPVRPAVWSGKHAFIPEWLDKPLHWRKPRVVAVNWLGDMWRRKVPLRWIDRVLEVIQATPQHQYLCLTKRACNLDHMLYATSVDSGARVLGGGDYLPNLWLGATVCNQREEKDATMYLCRNGLPGFHLWLSVEPMLGPVDVHWWLRHGGIRWVVAGAETGPGARPCDPAWLDDLRQQCSDAGVPYWQKQPTGPRQAPPEIAGILG
jgi:protein gp37